tara:strand:+ start:115 stop:372 length:258 start_codon:yes stop_codon:yes gene_type:complete
MDKRKKKKRSTLNEIVAEITHDLGLKKKDKILIRQVLTLLFKEIAIILILKGKPVMIRRFVKFVIAVKIAKKIKRSIDKLKTKKK